MANRNLNNTIKIGEETYNLNAVKSDIASRVTRSLNLYKSLYNNGGYAPSDPYNGSVTKDLYYVSAKEGGTFEKPIKVTGNTPDNLVENPNTVVTYKDIIALIQKLDGATWYTWDGENLEANTTTIINEQGEEELAYEPMAVVVGESSEISFFNDYNDDPNNQNKLPLYLYIGTYDSANTRAGDLFLGGTGLDVSSPIQLASRATSIYDSNGNRTKTAAEIIDDLVNLAITNTQQTNQIDAIKAGTIKVGHAKKADDATKAKEAEHAKEADNADNADNAVDAQYAKCDETGKDIKFNYYRTYGSYADNTVINSIRIVPGTKPSDNDGKLGDICIVY